MKQKKLTDWIAEYEPFIESIVSLFHPFVEAAVHDLKTGKIARLYHNFSQRKVGDKSPLHELKIETSQFPDYFLPYYKENWDGRPLKCTSITLRDAKGTPIGLICFNVDTSFFQESRRLLESFLTVEPKAGNPIELFAEDGQEQILRIIEEYAQEQHLSLTHLTKQQKKELIQALYHKGIFNFKNAAPVLAKTLKLSRASVYNYIKQIIST